MSWFTDIYPKVPRDFPPDLVLDVRKKYRIKIIDKTARKVRGGFGRLTAVVEVEYEGDRRSLFVGSHVDLARQISNIELEKGSLEGIILDIVKNSKRGRSYTFDIDIITTDDNKK